MSNFVPAHLSRKIWSFNVDVARYAHPAWLAEFRRTWPARWVCNRRMQSRYLIATYALALTQPDIMESPLERIALLSAHDTHRLIRCWIARLCIGYLRANVVGRVARSNARVLGAAVIDHALEEDGLESGSRPALPPGQGIQVNAPADLVVLHRRLLRTIYESLSPEAAARFRLRFRPECFERVEPVHGLTRFELWLRSTEWDVHLSKEGVCILSFP
ncbi:hypothetical protein ACVHYJ_17540 [Burkholderia pyrrocinia]